MSLFIFCKKVLFCMEFVGNNGCRKPFYAFGVYVLMDRVVVV